MKRLTHVLSSVQCRVALAAWLACLLPGRALVLKERHPSSAAELPAPPSFLQFGSFAAPPAAWGNGLAAGQMLLPGAAIPQALPPMAPAQPVFVQQQQLLQSMGGMAPAILPGAAEVAERQAELRNEQMQMVQEMSLMQQRVDQVQQLEGEEVAAAQQQQQQQQAAAAAALLQTRYAAQMPPLYPAMAQMPPPAGMNALLAGQVPGQLLAAQQPIMQPMQQQQMPMAAAMVQYAASSAMPQPAVAMPQPWGNALMR